jgi:hypothetical protein
MGYCIRPLNLRFVPNRPSKFRGQYAFSHGCYEIADQTEESIVERYNLVAECH